MIFELVDDLATIHDKILQEMIKQLNPAFSRARDNILEDIRSTLYPIFSETETYSALVNGPLDAHFGFHKGTSKRRVDTIITELQKQVLVSFTNFSKNLSGGLDISIIESDFLKIMSLNVSHTITERGQDLPWLEWLLIRGNELIIQNYDIVFTSDPRSRSGKALMVRNSSQSWSVPSEYAGTINDNWITRSLIDILTELKNIFDVIIKRNIEKIL